MVHVPGGADASAVDDPTVLGHDHRGTPYTAASAPPRANHRAADDSRPFDPRWFGRRGRRRRRWFATRRVVRGRRAQLRRTAREWRGSALSIGVVKGDGNEKRKRTGGRRRERRRRGDSGGHGRIFATATQHNDAEESGRAARMSNVGGSSSAAARCAYAYYGIDHGERGPRLRRLR